jgi:exopolysaccharide biosynthesis polyprenyl glycosylphosphotransferase
LSLFFRLSWTERAILLAGDFILFPVAVLAGYWVRFLGEIPPHNLEPYVRVWPIASVAGLCVYTLYGLYNKAGLEWTQRFISLLAAASVTLIVNMALSFFSRGFAIPRTVLLLSAVFQFILTVAWHYALTEVARRRIAANNGSLVMLGSEEDIKVQYDKVMRTARGLSTVTACRVNGNSFQNIVDAIDLHDMTLILPSVSLSLRETIVQECLRKDKRVFIVPGLYELALSNPGFSQLEDTLVFDVRGVTMSQTGLITKRMMDIVLSVVLIVSGIPLMLLTALVIWVDSGSPILFRQERVSRGGKVFLLYKFRTMIPDAEAETGPVVATLGDARVTRIGRLLRATRLDELPQLLNVLVGDMSLVGPRPERPVFVESFRETIPGYDVRHRVKPGVTGLAQIRANYSTPAAEKLRFDLLYVQLYSIWLDLRILLDTLRTVLDRRQASG